MFKWLDKLLSRSYDKAADEVERVVKEIQAPPFRNPTHPSKKKPRIGKDAQNLVLWLEKNEFLYYADTKGLRERCAFVNNGDAYCVERIVEHAKNYYIKYFYEVQLVYTDDETSWILYNAKRIQGEREKQREKELKEQFK